MTLPGRLRNLAGLLAAACLLAALPAATAQATVAPGCTTARPSYVGGTLVGVPDGRALDAHIGVTVGYKTTSGFVVLDPGGGPGDPALAGYSWIDHLNPTVPATGTTDPAAQRTWGMCVAATVRLFYAEVYPKAPSSDPATQRTDKSRYGSTAYYSGTVTVGQRLNVGLRAPVTFQAGAGNTGGVQGYITYKGVPVPAANITRVRAFPGPGATCGVEGYSAAADQLLTAAGPVRTYYRLDYLAGGQCGATSQAYSFQVTCAAVCGAAGRTFVRQISVRKGQWPRFDVAFT